MLKTTQGMMKNGTLAVMQLQVKAIKKGGTEW